jgi:hypothetical protein
MPHARGHMSWFEELTGFRENDYEATRAQLRVEGDRLRSLANGRSWQTGRLETPSLAELRERAAPALAATSGPLRVRNMAADAHALHARPELTGALVQVASQFNLLEMTHFEVSPEDGVTRYQYDATQGPACARAAGAGTIYRNYFAPVGDHVGQTREQQIDTLADLRSALPGGQGITMRNGYALADTGTLRTIRTQLEKASPAELDALRARLRIGLHWDVEVTAAGAPSGQCVSQAYCSALPVSYNRDSNPALWQAFARLVLEASYEATLLAGVINAAHPGGSQSVYLTLLGGGAFGNEREWILAAIRRALDTLRGQALDVSLVSYGSVPADLQALVADYEQQEH